MSAHKMIGVVVVFMLGSSSVWGQAVELDERKMQGMRSVKESMQFKPQQLEADKSERIEVLAIGGPSFWVANTADGTVASYDHAVRISYPLTLVGNRSGYQLVFYSEKDKIPYAVETKEGITSIYFPMSAHESLRTRLEQALVLKKRVSLKLVQRMDGYREALFGIN